MGIGRRYSTVRGAQALLKAAVRSMSGHPGGSPYKPIIQLPVLVIPGGEDDRRDYLADGDMRR